jgi:hypothetical protein
MTTLDIRGTVVGETAIAIKAPCLVATTGANIVLSGVQTIDGVTVGNNSERVLVKDQTVQSQNGIYIAASGAWVLAADFTSNNNVAFGSLVLVTSGNTNAGILFEQLCTDNPVVIGTSLIAFGALANQTAQAATSTTSLTVGTGSKTLTIQSGKAFAANQYVVIYETSAPSTNVMLVQPLAMTTNSTTVFGTSSYVTTALTKAVTLSSTTNAVKLSASGWGVGAASGASGTYQIQRGTVALGQPVAVGTGANSNFGWTLGAMMDVPASANWGTSLTYAVYGKGNGVNNWTDQGGSFYIEEIQT